MISDLMVFCHYTNRDAILRLKDEDQVKKMFENVLELEELIPDEQRADMFGIFERKPSLLRILPGLQPGFTRWLQEVEDLIPKRHDDCPTSDPPDNKRKKLSLKQTSSSKEKKKKKLTVVDINERLKTWLKKIRPLNLSILRIARKSRDQKMPWECIVLLTSLLQP